MDKSIINISPDNKMPPKRGRLLISEPFLADPYFKRTVVLLCEHNAEGSFGFVLNKFVDVSVNELVDDLPEIQTRISMGGPVKSGNLYYIHTMGDRLANSLEIVDGVFMGGDFEMLKELIKLGKVTNEHVRFFVGYSGWGQDQLKEEMDERSWLVAQSDQRAIMDFNNDDLWGHTLKKMGDEFAMLANFPEDPSLN